MARSTMISARLRLLETYCPIGCPHRKKIHLPTIYQQHVQFSNLLIMRVLRERLPRGASLAPSLLSYTQSILQMLRSVIARSAFVKETPEGKVYCTQSQRSCNCHSAHTFVFQSSPVQSRS